MRLSERISLYIKILLPFLFLVITSAYPTARAVADAAHAARDAQQSGNHQAAAEALRQVWTHETWRADLLEPIGRESLQAGNVDQAVDFLSKAEHAQSLSPDGRFQLGEAYLQRGDIPAAQAAWKTLLHQENRSADELQSRAYERLFQTQREQGDFSAAIQTLRAWHAAHPQNPRAEYLLGLLLSAEKPEEALPLLIDSAKQDSTYTPTVQVLRAGLSLASSADQPAYAWLLIGRSLGSAGQWDLAEQAFQKSTQSAPQYAEAWAFLGEAHYHLGKGSKADLDKAAALDPKSSVVQALMALYWRRQGKPEQALPILQSIAAQEPKEPSWQIEIGYTLVEKGDLPAAQEAFQKAVEIAPSSAYYWQMLAEFSIAYNVDIRALGLPAARQAVLLAPKDPGPLDAMGWALLKLEDSASAERFLQRALDRDATYAPAYLHMGQLYLNQHDMQKAHPYLSRAASLAGDESTSQIARRLLLQYFNEGG